MRFGPLSVNINCIVLFFDGPTTCTVWNVDSDVRDVQILETKHLPGHAVDGVLAQCTSVVDDVSDNDQFAGIFTVGDVHHTTSLDESLVNHVVVVVVVVVN